LNWIEADLHYGVRILVSSVSFEDIAALKVLSTLLWIMI